MSKADELQRRVEAFADDVLRFCESIQSTARTVRIVEQLIGAATSVAANYRAARRARSHAEFTAKIGLVTEEADETEYWLGVTIRNKLGEPMAAIALQAEALELTRIFARSAKTARSRHRSPNH